MLLGGGRALILQMAHPHIGAAVDQHSRYRDDRWGRLRHTLKTVGEILFGDTPTALRSAERMRRQHARYRGVVPAGRAAGDPYDASDPALILWVWATLVDSALTVYERFVGSLSAAEIDRYYEEQQAFAHLCGVPARDVPPTYPAFRNYFSAMVRDTLEATPAAREATEMVMNPFKLPPIAAPVALLMGLPTAGLLPDPLRTDLGIGWTSAKEALLRLVAMTFQLIRPVLPVSLRRVRSARQARKRVSDKPPGR
jgi:uncharacterized protein (DUF2236 family)